MFPFGYQLNISTRIRIKTEFDEKSRSIEFRREFLISETKNRFAGKLEKNIRTPHFFSYSREIVYLIYMYTFDLEIIILIHRSEVIIIYSRLKG